jgi:thioredoxin-like negative regulator of GroEL
MMNLSQNGFQCAVEESAYPVIVKFHAGWCPDCRRIEPAYAEFPDKYRNALFAAVDIEANPDLAQRFDVKGIPTFLVFREGRLADRLLSRDAKTSQQVEVFVAQQVNSTVRQPEV